MADKDASQPPTPNAGAQPKPAPSDELDAQQPGAGQAAPQDAPHSASPSPPPVRDRTVIGGRLSGDASDPLPLTSPDADDAAPAASRPYPHGDGDEDFHGLGPVIETSSDHTVIASGGDGGPAPTEQRTIIGTAAPSSTPPPPPAPAKLVEPGTLINNNYRIEELVSAGGMGEVYRAANVYTGDPVAVKVILPELARDQDIIDLFRREARVLVQLRDDAIVSYHNFVLDHGLNRYCLIMEFVVGTHLGARLGSDAGMADDQALALMRRLARGLGQAHARGVTHRDLSPDNVILRHDRVDEAVLIDFGIARSTELGDGLAGRFAGKFKYIAPEQLGHYDGVIGPQTDIYGLALLVTAVLRGKPLEMGDSVVTASDARQKIPNLSGLSHRLFPVLQYMLEPDPAHRPENMAQIVAMLDDPMRIPARYRLPLWTGTSLPPTPITEISGISESPFGAPIAPQPGLAAQPAPQPKSRLPIVMGGVAAGLLIAAGLGWFMMRGADAGDDVGPTPEDITAAPTLPPRDPASRDGFLAGLALGPCAMAQRITSGTDAGTIALYSADAVDSAQVLGPYDSAFGTRPAVTALRVGTAQCPALDFARALAGRVAAPPIIESAARATPTGFQTEAQVTGLAGRTHWLALIAPDGSVYDLTGQATTAADGTVRVGASVDVPGATAPGAPPYLLLAVASSQPLVTIAAAPAGAPAQTLLPAILNELQADGDAAAANLSLLAPAPAPQPVPAPEPEPEPAGN